MYGELIQRLLESSTHGRKRELCFEAATAIDKLRAALERKDETREQANRKAHELDARCSALEGELEKVRRERDTAVAELKDSDIDCDYCKHSLQPCIEDEISA